MPSLSDVQVIRQNLTIDSSRLEEFAMALHPAAAMFSC
jgi:hypothetical protein